MERVDGIEECSVFITVEPHPAAHQHRVIVVSGERKRPSLGCGGKVQTEDRFLASSGLESLIWTSRLGCSRPALLPILPLTASCPVRRAVAAWRSISAIDVYSRQRPKRRLLNELYPFSASMVAASKFAVEVRINESHIKGGTPNTYGLASTGQSGPDKSPRRGPGEIMHIFPSCSTLSRLRV